MSDWGIIIKRSKVVERAILAQLVEHILGKDEVVGSNPIDSSIWEAVLILHRGGLFFLHANSKSCTDILRYPYSFSFFTLTQNQPSHVDIQLLTIGHTVPETVRTLTPGWITHAPEAS